MPWSNRTWVGLGLGFGFGVGVGVGLLNPNPNPNQGQLKPPDDDGIRFGKLLFGETLSDYAGWSEAAGGSEAATKDKLLGR